ncbi:Arc family DNA-binding protein [Pseudomonas sp. DG56-2]|uniref:Arc family DNA-binding protein n=1 Tax=Pseudomonas sp. DG56-2 TaxID=2320270 RepID=UPI0010A69E4E|nr:Arc family DNA-binding protein [Pseudomonas sp. DG56-2]
MSSRHKITPFPLRMPAEVKEYLDGKAEKEERSLNWLICKVLKEAMESEQGKIQASS